MRLIKRLFELAVFLFFISLFMMNKDASIDFNYFGLSHPIKLAFWELVTISVSIGIIVAAIGDFLSQLKWMSERRKLQKQAAEHQQKVDSLNARIEELEADNDRMRNELEQRPAGLDSMLAQSEIDPNPGADAKSPYSLSDPDPVEKKEKKDAKREPFKEDASFGSLASAEDYVSSPKSVDAESVEKSDKSSKGPEQKEKKDPWA